MFLHQTFNYSSKILSLTTKVLVNQVAFAPLFNSYFFGMQALLSGDNFAEAWAHIKRTVPTSLINSCKLWPAVTAFSFTFIHAQYRALFAGQPAPVVIHTPKMLTINRRRYRDRVAVISVAPQPKSRG